MSKNKSTESSVNQNPASQSENDQSTEFGHGSIEATRFGRMRHTNITEEMKQSYLDYAMSVIVARALPDVRDGMKPVHRRILYSMYKSGIHYHSAYKKSARIVGDVLGKYHPHGDSSVYLAMVRLAQDFSMRYPLVDGQGNFGSVDGDSPAAMRYTEARLAKITNELLADIDKDTVKFSPNFDGSLEEPTVLPAKLPNLLLMGSEGIAVGMATKIPPHNLSEVVDAIISLMDKGKATRLLEIEAIKISPDDKHASEHPIIDQLIQTEAKKLSGQFSSEATVDDIMTHIQGPDFPTGGIIYDFKTIKEGYRTGKGRVIIRAKATIEEDKKGFKILVTELPYQVNKARLLMKIAGLVRDKKIAGIRNLNDDSDRSGLQITIELKRDTKPKVVLNKLFKYSELQTSFPMNMVALNHDGIPQLMNIKQILLEYVIHRQEVVVRRAQYELKQARARAHILEGLLIALDNIDAVIETIKKSKDTETAKTALMSKFKLSEIQSLAILDMQLKRLAALERKKIEDEYAQIQEQIGQFINLLVNPQRILKLIKSEILTLKTNYGDARRTKLIKGKVGEFSEEDLVANEPTVITLTESGYIKRMQPSSFRSQSRGGKGKIGLKMKAEDMVHTLLTAQTHDSLLLFTNLGKVFKLKVYEIPEASRQAKGTAVVNLLNLTAHEKVQSLLLIDEVADENKYISLATKKGLVKKSAVKLYRNIRQNGIIAIVLNEGDELVWGKLTTGEDDIILITHQGKSIRFTEKEVKSSQRDTKGVRGITLKPNDYVIGVEAITPKNRAAANSKDEPTLLIITEKGLGKRTKFQQYPTQKRAGLGVKVAEINQKTGAVAAARTTTLEHKNVVITSKEGQTIRLPLNKKSIPILTRPTQGVILMRLKSGDKVAAVALAYKKIEGGE